MTALIEIKVPDVGNVAEIDVVEVLIQPGDIVALEQTIATLETDKASMELPSSTAGTIQQIFIKPGDKVSEGTLIATVLPSVAEAVVAIPEAPAQQTQVPVKAVEAEKVPAPASAPITAKPESIAPEIVTSSGSMTGKAHASPSVRLFARELGVDVNKI
ncbi:MAG: biotin/lipoyl-containing protein, partial [Methylococcaceae bacterium]